MKLNSLDISYEKVEVERNNKPAVVRETGGTVPVMDIGGKIISDSTKIIAYLEGHFPSR